MDPYENRKISLVHEVWKQTMNDVFVKLLEVYIKVPINVVYLDAGCGETTKALQSLNHVKCFVGNNSQNAVDSLKQFKDVTVEFGKISDCLIQCWKTTPFQAAYFDACAAQPENIILMMEAFFQRSFISNVPIIIGYTMVGRAKDGRSQLNRTEVILKSVTSIAKRLSMKLTNANTLNILDRKMDWLHDAIFTNFFVFEPIHTEQIELLETKFKTIETEIEDIKNVLKPAKPIFIKAANLQVLPIEDRKDGICCIVGCKNFTKHKRSNICLDNSHILARKNFGERLRDKKRRDKQRKIPKIRITPKILTLNRSLKECL